MEKTDRMHFKDGYRLIDGKKQFVMGINYLPASTGHSIRFYTQPDFDEIAADCSLIASLNLNVVRFGLPFDLIDRNGNADPLITANLEKIIALCATHSLMVVLTFFHLASFQEDPSAERPAWTRPDVYYTSDESFGFITKYMQVLAARYANDDRIFAWDVGNEPWWHAGMPPKDASGVPDRTILTAYAKKLTAKFRELGFRHPLTFGADHAAVAQQVGADIVALTDVSDFVSTHFYSKYVYEMFRFESVNTFRDTHFGPFIMKFSRHHDKPVGCWEFGNSTLQVSEENQAVYQRILSYSSFIAGAHCLFPWAFCDFDRSTRHLYNAYAQQELEFGIVRRDKTPKRAVKELEGFLRTVNAIDLDTYSFPRPEAAIYVDKAYYDRLSINYGTYVNAYMLARAANIPVDFIRHDEDLSRYRLLFVPNGLLTIEEMDALTRFVENGGTLFMSFNKHVHSMAPGYLQNLFGFELLDYRRMPEQFGVTIDYAQTSERYHTTLNLQGMAPGPVVFTFFHTRPTTAEIAAADQSGNPVLCVNRYGKGRALSCMVPLEMCLSCIDDAFQKIPAYLFYAIARSCSDISRDVVTDNPFIETGFMKGSPGDGILFLVNHEPEFQQVTLRFRSTPRSIADFHSGEPVAEKLGLVAHEVRVLKVEFKH